MSTKRLWPVAVGAAAGGFVVATALSALLPVDAWIRAGEAVAVILFAAAGVLLAIVDATTRRLPNRGTVPFATGMLGYWLGLALTTGQWQLVTQAVLCAIALTIVAGIIAAIGSLAFGDVKLAISIGLLTGWFSWMLPFYAIAAGYLLAIPHAAILIARRRRTPGADNRLPFGPYLIAGATLATSAALLAR